MRSSTYAVHAPALSLQEAAMLPAQDRTPRNLLIPSGHLEYRTGHVDGGGYSVDNFSSRRGSMAGRALLAYVKSASAQRRRR